MPKQNEIATLTVNGEEFRDWETIYVRHALREQPPYRYRFTCSEGMPLAKNWAKLRIKPGDVCTIKLANQLAITGKVHTRQVFYDKNKHYVEIQGATWTLDLSGASVVTKTMEFKDVTFEQLAKAILAPFKIAFKVEGGSLPQIKFPRVSIPHGMTAFDVLDIHARDLGISFTSDAQGSFVAIAGPNGGSDSVIEGKNILEGREILYSPAMEANVPALAQGTGNNKKWGADVASVPFMNKEMQGLAQTYMPFALPLEVPTSDQQHLDGRGSAERNWLKEDQVTVYATVYGWQRPSDGQLWYRDQTVHVTSPMLIMDTDLTAKSVTFLQENGTGTRTILELCNANALSGIIPELKQ